MRTISLLLLFVVSLTFAANRRRSEVLLFPKHEIPEPNSDQLKPMNSLQPNILIAISEAVRRGVGMRIQTNYTVRTEVVISQCGVPTLLIFRAETATGVISNEQVNAMHDFDCEENDEKTWISLTAKSDGYIKGNTQFAAELEKEDFGPVKIHNISAPVIAKVDFLLPMFQMNKWPIKIGRLLREASEPNTHLILSVDSTDPITFIFSKCGHIVDGIPWENSGTYILDATQINAIRAIYNQKCEKPWLDGVIELKIYSDDIHTVGTIEFKLVKEDMKKQAEEEKEPSIESIATRLVLIALLLVVICCAVIMIAVYIIVVFFPHYCH